MIYEKSSSTHQSHRSSRAPIRASVLVLLALAFTLLLLAVSRAEEAGAEVISAFTPSSETGAFTPSAAPALAEPTVVTKAASAVTQTTATLNATVNPNGEAVSECKFEYGTTPTPYTSSVPCTQSPASLGTGTSPVAVSAAVTGLAPNSTYHFRISATNPGATSKGSDETFITPENPPTAELLAASAVTQKSATLNGTVNPHGETVTECVFQYGPTYEFSAPCSPLPGSGSSPERVSAAVTGLTPNTSYHFRIIATSAGGTGERLGLTFKTLPNAPAVVTRAASALTQTTATLNATVNPNGGEVSKCEFEYGPTEAYGSTASCSSLPGSGSSPVAVSAAVTGLAANTTYHFRISATNAGGTEKGSDETFKTTLLPPPTVVTGAASSLTQTSATLNATVNPNGVKVTKCEFEYGTTSSYGSSAPCSSPPGSGTIPVAVSASVTGLSANTTYHFRISATNAGGTGKGSDETFTTPPAPAPTSPPNSGSGSGGGGTSVVVTGLPAPVLARSANVARVVGQVRIRLPGTRAFVTLSTARQIPYGTIVEAIHGEVSVTAATPGGGTQRGQFFDGEFVLSQGTNGRVLVTLTGGNFAVCPPPARAAGARPAPARSKYASRTHLVRRLWAEARGNFSSKGRYAGGIVTGAQWLTEDMCAGTLILATRERVEVNDLVRHRHAQVVTGGIYLAKAR